MNYQDFSIGGSPGRGLNVVILDKSTFNRKDFKKFDTH